MHSWYQTQDLSWIIGLALVKHNHLLPWVCLIKSHTLNNRVRIFMHRFKHNRHRIWHKSTHKFGIKSDTNLDIGSNNMSRKKFLSLSFKNSPSEDKVRWCNALIHWKCSPTHRTSFMEDDNTCTFYELRNNRRYKIARLISFFSMSNDLLQILVLSTPINKYLKICQSYQ